MLKYLPKMSAVTSTTSTSVEMSPNPSSFMPITAGQIPTREGSRPAEGPITGATSDQNDPE
jgi:hypothetical protein